MSRRTLALGTAALLLAGAAAAAGAGDGSDAGAGSAARVELGRRLFFDPAVSQAGRTSCASCHDPEHGFTDPVHPSRDEWGPTARRTMPLADLPPGELHSDGEFRTFRKLLDARIEPPADLVQRIELDVREGSRLPRELPLESTPPRAYGMVRADPPSLVSVADRLAADGLYRGLLAAAFGDAEPTHARVCDALEAYARSLRTTTSAFDRHLAGDASALSPEAARGRALFEHKAGCAQCHVTKPLGGRAPLTDGDYHDTGVAFRAARADGRQADLGHGAHAWPGFLRRARAMHFRTPSLRDVARRGPYMHDGSLPTLLHVVDWYDGGTAPHPGLDPRIRKLGLTPAEKEDLLAFLVALSGDERPGLVDAPARPAPFRATVVRPDGTPVADAPVEVEPCGERFRGEAARPLLVATDAQGVVEFPFPRSTHVRLRAAGFGLVHGGEVPDCADAPKLLAVPAEQVALRVRAGPGSPPRRIVARPVPKTRTDGKVVEPAAGREIAFRFVRAVTDRESLYVADAPGPDAGSTLRHLVPDGNGGGALPGVLDLDLRGGAITWADLTPLRHRRGSGSER